MLVIKSKFRLHTSVEFCRYATEASLLYRHADVSVELCVLQVLLHSSSVVLIKHRDMVKLKKSTELCDKDVFVVVI